MDRREVGILIFNEAEVLDFCGPYEVFSVTRLNEERRQEEPSPFRAFLVVEEKIPVVCSGGMQVVVRHFGETVARATARYMEYPFPERDTRRIAIA